MRRHLVPFALALAGLYATSLSSAELSAATSTGTVSGLVSNKTTGNGLEGATVAIPQIRLTTLVDNTGRYVFNGVPPGTYEIVASYTGLDVVKSTVTVAAGQRSSLDFEMSSSIYLLDTFKVAGEREGYAAAITAQRNADNVKNVVSMDAYGNLPNLNATELALRLPGVYFADPGEEVVEGISIRGQGMGLNSITIDGGLMASYSGMNRQSRMTAFTGAMFESLELIKGQTPDQGADSLGGRVNFRTRSPLNMRENRRTTYSLSAVWAAPFTEQIPMRREHRVHPLINVSHMQKFKVFGSESPNLAVSINAFYSENVFGYYQTDRDFQQTNTQPAFLWDYRTTDNYNVRKQDSINTKFDFRLSPTSKLSLSVIYSNAPEPARRRIATRYTTGSQTTVPNATSGIVPGWTDRVTTVRAVPAAATAGPGSATATITQTAELISRNQRLRHVTLNGEHVFGNLQLDWTGDISRMRYRTLGKEANLQTRIGAVPTIGPNGQPGTGANTIVGPNGESGVGWVIDRTQSDLFPTITRNGGLDFFDPQYWRPSQLSSNSGDLNVEMFRDIRGNALYRLPIDSENLTLSLKTGGGIRNHTNSDQNTNRHQWSYIGRTALPTSPSVVFYDTEKTGRRIPYWEPSMFIDNGQVKDPSLWSENRFFHEQNQYTGFRRIQEIIYSGYLQAQGKIGHNGFLGGARVERTDTNAENFLRSKVQSSAAQQAADPVGAARADYAGNFRKTDGSYTHVTPSIHVYRNFTPSLKARVSWSTGFARPNMSNALPNETVNDDNMTVTIGNPALKPQTSKTWDVTLEYYFEPSGLFTVGWFHKDTADYIVNNIATNVIEAGPNNGYNGQYVGYTERTFANAGSATTQGWEFSYVQQLRFLPGLLSGLSVNANFTMLDTHGMFTGTTYLRRDHVSGVIPRTGNVSLSWNYRKFGTRILYNYTAQSIRNTYNFANPSRNTYMLPRETVNLGVTYQFRPDLKFSVDVQNLTNEAQRQYRGIPDQVQQVRIQPPKITIGVQGQF